MKKVSIACDYYEIRKIIGMHKHEILKCSDRIDEVVSTNRYGIRDRFSFVMQMQAEIEEHEKRVCELNRILEQFKK